MWLRAMRKLPAGSSAQGGGGPGGLRADQRQAAGGRGAVVEQVDGRLGKQVPEEAVAAPLEVVVAAHAERAKPRSERSHALHRRRQQVRLLAEVAEHERQVGPALGRRLHAAPEPFDARAGVAVEVREQQHAQAVQLGREGVERQRALDEGRVLCQRRGRLDPVRRFQSRDAEPERPEHVHHRRQPDGRRQVAEQRRSRPSGPEQAGRREKHRAGRHDQQHPPGRALQRAPVAAEQPAAQVQHHGAAAERRGRRCRPLNRAHGGLVSWASTAISPGRPWACGGTRARPPGRGRAGIRP